jgi:uncharacterized repeat protein (TIGR04138 family)
MALVDPAHPLAQLLQRDRRYKLDAYLFVLESLSFAQDTLGMGEPPQPEDVEPRGGGTTAGRKESERHISGQQLCEAARQYALQQYGYLSRTVLGTWGIHSTADLGEIVFNMIEIGQMRKTRKDKREDFHDVYDFHDAFSRDLSFVVPDGV